MCSSKKPIAKIEAKSFNGHRLVRNHDTLRTSGVEKKKLKIIGSRSRARRLKSHGAFSALLHPGASFRPKDLRMATWNPRGFLCVNTMSGIKKAQYLLDNFRCTHIVALQEVHGNDVILRSRLSLLHKSHWFFHSPGKDQGTGGTVTMVKKEFAPQF